MSDVIIYGGAFNPPTIGHLKIIEYLVNKFPNNKIIILPTNNFYKSKDIVSFDHRKKMLEEMCKDSWNWQQNIILVLSCCRHSSMKWKIKKVNLTLLVWHLRE